MTRLTSFAARAMRKVRDLSRREDGTATLDFVILVPLFMSVFVSNFELSYLMIRQTMLERGLDMAVRDLRLGTWPNVTTDILKTEICSRTINLIPDCEDVLLLELTTISNSSWSMPDPQATCVDRSADVQPVVSFDPGTENQMVIIRACVIVDPFFPGTGLALKLEQNIGDGYALVATSGFVNEPGNGT